MILEGKEMKSDPLQDPKICADLEFLTSTEGKLQLPVAKLRKPFPVLLWVGKENSCGTGQPRRRVLLLAACQTSTPSTHFHHVSPCHNPDEVGDDRIIHILNVTWPYGSPSPRVCILLQKGDWGDHSHTCEVEQRLWACRPCLAWGSKGGRWDG